ncbi:phage tail protein [Lacrimispora sp.]|uniref:phage tail protein n=1 Tax=Lacrimispora sp. TaxID=2719234 RepID=UPI002856987E|nr:tail fiber protein [Lacrimispora sp.]MDR7812059.1 tail fiber protein [Lacrimispora sp.]
MCEDKKSCITINCGCCSNGNNNGNDNTPVGAIISYMGTTAPKHYLICDGTIYNIDDYKEFSQFIKDEHGSFEFFGGDGTTTFAVPDLRGEFLRGTGAGSRNTGSGAAVGVHQNATIAPGWYNNDYGTGVAIGLNDSDIDRVNNTVLSAENTDFLEMGNYGYMQLNGTIKTSAKPIRSFTSRPTNTAVLYCIKYE